MWDAAAETKAHKMALGPPRERFVAREPKHLLMNCSRTDSIRPRGATAYHPLRKLALWRETSGQSLVEAALVLPILLVVAMGVLAFGLAFNNYIALTEATGVGARQLAISRGTTLDPCATVATAISGAAPLLRASGISYTIVLNGTSYSASSCPSSSTTSGPAGNLQQGSTATVTASYPCQLLVMGVSLVPSCNLTAQTSEAIQ